MDKEEVKKMLCKAIDNIPQCAEIKDCYTEHNYGEGKAYIKILVEVKDKSESSVLTFHNIAHEAFNTDMGFMS